jgi:hypothetical protein
VACVYLFFSFKYDEVCYLCALIHWFSTVGEAPDEETMMWMVEPDYLAGKKPLLEVIHLDTILQGAHLIGVAGHTPSDYLPSQPKIDFLMALDLFKSFYVNKFADHHAHSLNCIPVLSKLICILTNFIYREGSPDVAVLDKVKDTPVAKAQEGTCGLDGESAAHMRKEESALTENTFNVDQSCLSIWLVICEKIMNRSLTRNRKIIQSHAG